MKAEGVNISSRELASVVEEMTGREARFVVPGYIQRGGTPSGRDRMLASMMSTKAVKLLFDDEPSKAVGISGSEIIAYDLAEALAMKSEFRKDLYDIAETLA